MVEIIAVATDDEIATVKELIHEFLDWLADRYPDMAEQIAYYFSKQGFAEEMADLLGTYGPPGGVCLLARVDGTPAGILMMKPHGLGEVEMNRMYVRPNMRGRGVARALANRLLTEARELGYDRMILSALDRHHEALPLYTSLGFTDDSQRPPDTGDEREVRLKLDLRALAP